MIRIIEAVQGYLKHLNESLAECATSASETAKSMAIMSSVMGETTKKLVQLFEQQQEQNERINKYIWDQAQKDRADAKFAARLTDIESHIRAKKAAGDG